MSRSEVADLPVEAGGVLSEDVLAVVIGLVVFGAGARRLRRTRLARLGGVDRRVDRPGQGAGAALQGLCGARRRGRAARHLRRAARRADGRGVGARPRRRRDSPRLSPRLSCIAYASWFVGAWAHLAAVTPADQAKFGIDWSLKLTNEGGYIVALVVGLVIANFFPRFAEWLKEAIRPELYIKIAIVILGAFVAVTAASKLTLASSLLLRGLAAIVEAYLIYWAVVYYIARKWFGFSREWAAPLASGISICGVAAAIATGGAIRARPQVPVLVSSLVVVFAVVEVLVLPWIAQTYLRA